MSKVEHKTIDDWKADALRRLTDQQLRDLRREAWDWCRRLGDGETNPLALMRSDTRSDYPALVYVMLQLEMPLDEEDGFRREAERDAEIAIEANGHEVGAHFEGVLHKWFALCHCEQRLTDAQGREYVDTEAEGQAIAQRHINDTGGRWWTPPA